MTSPVFQNIAGTLKPAFKIGKVGPTLHQGDTDPNDSLIAGTNGDLYIWCGVDSGALYQYQDNTWVNISSEVPLATPETDGLLSSLDKVKIDSIADSATQNDSDEQLRDRATHTGMQDINTVEGLQEYLDKFGLLSNLTTLDKSNLVDAINEVVLTAQLAQEAASTVVNDTTVSAAQSWSSQKISTEIELSGKVKTVNSIEPDEEGNIALLEASTSNPGLLTPIDKAKLDSVEPSASGFTMDEVPPLNPKKGHRWLDTTTSIEYTWFVEGESQFWIETGPGGGTGLAGEDGTRGPQGKDGPPGAFVGIPTLVVTQAEYDALTPDAGTLYVVVG